MKMEKIETFLEFTTAYVLHSLGNRMRVHHTHTHTHDLLDDDDECLAKIDLGRIRLASAHKTAETHTHIYHIR